MPSFIGNLVFLLILITSITDLTFGFKILSTELISKLNLKACGHDIYAETTIFPIIIGARCCEVPTVWRGRTQGTSTLSVGKAIRVYLKIGLRAFLKTYFNLSI